MSDIVERARKHEECVRLEGCENHALILEMAGEIERLRAALIEERHTILELQRELFGPLPSGNKTRLEKEVERMREALIQAT